MTSCSNQGVDVLEGGSGNDTRGGTLADTFIFTEGDDQDVIEDFRLGEDILGRCAHWGDLAAGRFRHHRGCTHGLW